MGGREALYIAAKCPTVFGAVGAFTPAPGLLPADELNYPGQLTKKDFKFSEDTYVLINAGKDDDLVNPYPERYAEVLKENSVEIDFYVMEGGHDFNVWKDGLVKFLKAVL